MRVDDKVVDQVQAANDIVEVVQQYLALKKAGRNYKARCPFHEEKTPSFMVSAEKQIFHCFGCGAGGNVFGFLMRYENISFPEALRYLAQRAHIPLPERPTHRSPEERSETEKIYEIYRLAAQYYHNQLMEVEKGKEARDYFAKRGFSLRTAEEFKIGWAPEAWRGLFDYLSQKGISNSLLFKARLIQQSSQGHPYDTFRGRLMFPIQNLQGKVVAFGGRLIREGEGPKYLNSPENPVFQKRRELFGLNVAKRFINRELPRIFLVEGYLDFLRLYGNGFKTTAATLGTALTEDHVTLLKRFAEEAVVIFDGDKAGEAASLRGLEVFLDGGLSVKPVRMPPGYDPDDFLMKEGPEKFRELISGAQDFFDYKLEILLGKYSSADSLGLMKITNEFLETLAKVKNPILLDRYLRQLSGTLGIDQNSLRAELLKLKGKTASDAKRKGSPVSSGSRSRFPAESQMAHEEVSFLGFLVDEPGFREEGFAEVSDSDFEMTAARQLFQKLSALFQDNASIGWPQVLNYVESADFKKALTAVASFDWSVIDKKKAFRDCLRAMKRKRLLRRLEELRREITKAEKMGNQDLVVEFAREYQLLLQQTKV